jgi:hypothetical protein
LPFHKLTSQAKEFIDLPPCLQQNAGGLGGGGAKARAVSLGFNDSAATGDGIVKRGRWRLAFAASKGALDVGSDFPRILAPFASGREVLRNVSVFRKKQTLFLRF